MSVDLKDRLHAAYDVEAASPARVDELWTRGRRAARRRRAAQVVAALVVAATVVLTAADLVGTRSVSVVAPLPGGEASAPGWDRLSPGTFTYDAITAQLRPPEVVAPLGTAPLPAFDVTDDGTIAVFDPGTGRVDVDGPDARWTADASFLLARFPTASSVHHLRLGPDQRVYLTSHAPDAPRDPHRTTVFDVGGELVGTMVTPPSHQPPVFVDGRVLLRADDGWVAVASVGGDLDVTGHVRAPGLPEVTWIGDQGSFLHQITGGPPVGERYILEQDGVEQAWTGPDDDVTGWASSDQREDRPSVVLVQHGARPPLVLAPRTDGLLAAWAPPGAEGLRGVGTARATVVTHDGATYLYWIERNEGRSVLVRARP